MKRFFKTVAVVTVFSVFEKFLGFLYRIYMSKTIGAEGIGLYQVALSVFGLLFTVACSGTPVTVSRLMTKYNAEGKKDKVYKVITAGFTVTLCISVPLCVIFLTFGKYFDFLFADERCLNIFLVILPGLIFTSVYSVLRGVFWGNKDFLPYSIIELLEEICMIIVGIFLIQYSTSVYDGAFRAGVAVLISFIFSFSLGTIVFFIRKNKLKNPKSELKPLLSSAMPVTAMRTASSLAGSLVSIIVPLRLVAAGLSESQALSAFGAATGQATPLLYTPSSIIGPFTLVLIPEISENYYKHQALNLKNNAEKAIKISTALTCLFIPAFTVCGKELGIIIFDSPVCGDYLSFSAFLMLFMSISSITTSMLNSMGYENKTLIYYSISTVFMLLCVFFLPKLLGVYSLIVGSLCVYGITSFLNLKLLNQKCPEKPRYKKFVGKCFLSCLPTAVLGLMLEKMIFPHLGLFFTFIVCTVIMVVFHLLLYFGIGIFDVEIIKKNLKLKKKTAVLKPSLKRG